MTTVLVINILTVGAALYMSQRAYRKLEDKYALMRIKYLSEKEKRYLLKVEINKLKSKNSEDI